MTLKPALILMLASGACALSAARAAEVTVYAAASLKDAFVEIAVNYEKAGPDHLRFNFAGSNVLAQQIQEGAPADLFVSADEAKMDGLQKAGLIDPATRRDLLSNTLVIVAPSDSALKLASGGGLAQDGIKRLALAEPKTVPAGIYAREYLEKAGLWDRVKTRVIPTENVRAVLAAVGSGNVDAGIVYKTDALISKEVKILYEIPAAEGPKVLYPAAVITGGKNTAAAKRLLEYLASDAGRKVFVKYGFLIQR